MACDGGPLFLRGNVWDLELACLHGRWQQKNPPSSEQQVLVPEPKPLAGLPTIKGRRCAEIGTKEILQETGERVTLLWTIGANPEPGCSYRWPHRVYGHI